MRWHSLQSKMMWVDKHRPKTIDELDLHKGVTHTLRNLAKSNDIPHVLFHGPSGAGKKTRVMALLREHYGSGITNMRLEHKTMPVTTSKSIDIAILSSAFHIDINPSDAGNYDRIVVMQLVREIAETVPLAAPVASEGARAAFKVVVLNEVDKMTRAAQQALRRTMEKYIATCRIVLICNSTSRLIPALRSRCLSIRIPAATADEVKKVVNDVLAKEQLSPLSTAFCSQLVFHSDGNLRRALLTVEAAHMCKANLGGDGRDIPLPDWKTYIAEIASDIVSEQTPKRLRDIRTKYYELLGQCIPGELVLREIVRALLSLCEPSIQADVIRAAAQYDHNMKLGSKAIMHLEAFTAHAMRALRSAKS